MRRARLWLSAGASLWVAGAFACAGGETPSFSGIDAGGGLEASVVARDASPTTTLDGGSLVPPGHDAGHDSSSHSDSGAAHDASHPTDAGHDATELLPEAAAETSIPDVFVSYDSALPQIPIVYGQSASVLYSLDPTTEAVTRVGLFIGCDSDVADIALDKDSNMYATTFGGIYTINKANAACTLIKSGTYPNSLSFVPAGTLDPNVEALVGYNAGTYVRIDPTTGAITTVGSLGSGGYSSSGDIVSVIGGGTYLTVTGGSDCTASDCLVEVDPITGALLTKYGSVAHSKVYGLAFWAGNLYGFDNGGGLFEVTFPDAGGLTIKTIPIPNAPLGLSFYGAGSTTAAPKR